MNKRRYTIEQIEWLRQRATTPRAELTRLYNIEFNEYRTKIQIISLCKNHKISTGRCNGVGGKGFKLNYSFIKGHISYNIKPIGATRICSKDKIVYIKTAYPNVWRPLHRDLLVKYYGELPKGMVVKFKNSCDKLNPSLDNLELITRLELLYLNELCYDKQPDVVMPTLSLVAKIKTKIVNRQRQKES